jgi:hypothetical protein
VIGISLAALWTDLDHGRLPADEEALSEAAEVIARDFQGGDAVVVRPAWNDGLWTLLSDMGPGTDTSPYPALLRGEFIDPVDVFRYRRIWALGSLHAAPALPGVSPVDLRSGELRHLGSGVSVQRHDLNSAGHLGSMTDALDSLEVKRGVAGEKARLCPFSRGGHRCGEASWLDVTIERHDVFHRDVTWLFAHAGPDDQTLTITWPNAPRAHLFLRAGFTQASTRRDAGSDLTLTLSIDDGPSLRETFEPRDYDLARLVVSPPDGPEQMVVRVSIQADRSSWRQLMLEVDLFETLNETLKSSADRLVGKPGA